VLNSFLFPKIVPFTR